MKTILWEVNYLSPPKAIRYCKKCGSKTAHLSSEAFRINAQQKSLDIWLVYRCGHCKNTWNLPIYSRINPKSISAELLDRFTNNDSGLALRYAMDIDLLNKNGADTEAPSYAVVGEDVDFTQNTKIMIACQYASKLKVSNILREKLALTKKAFDEMVSGGMLRMEDGADIHKCRLRQEATICFISIRAGKENP